ncbi:hypothetical protein [Streptosporangium sp. NBC_01756]|uniref:hypothetical protein n=1 Tax=Streptosporangium sp. NBC_01756 TaxID=2975950 RepID=UPI002DD874DC|nr:hypothetical protein [Streptosporangium sp. NBC_01756]
MRNAAYDGSRPPVVHAGSAAATDTKSRVCTKLQQFSALILGEESDLLTASAWLNDIGCSPESVDTGFHPLDGARYLRDVHQADDKLARLAAHHSCAVYEATERDRATGHGLVVIVRSADH